MHLVQALVGRNEILITKKLRKCKQILNNLELSSQERKPRKLEGDLNVLLLQRLQVVCIGVLLQKQKQKLMPVKVVGGVVIAKKHWSFANIL
jgi:hypothetical protein